MGITTVLFLFVMIRVWHWRTVPSVLLTAGLLTMEITFLAANILKIPHGGWVTLLIAAVALAITSNGPRRPSCTARRSRGSP